MAKPIETTPILKGDDAYNDYTHAAIAIKEAILNAQYEATRGVNNIQLMLYYAIGRFISLNTRKGKWGTGAIAAISRLLKEDMPGLRGYSEANLKKMRIFYEEWKELDSISFAQTNELKATDKSSIQTDDFKTSPKSFVQTNDLDIKPDSPVLMGEIPIHPFNFPAIDFFPANDFRSIGFTHHYNILVGSKL